MQRFRNVRKGPIVGVKLLDRADGTQTNVGSQECFIQHDEIGEFDEKSKAVQIYKEAGYLVPVPGPRPK